MPETIPGGYYQDSTGTMRDAHGNPLSKDALAAAKKHSDAHLAAQEAAERDTMISEAQQNPFSRALAGLVTQPAAAQSDDRDARIAALEAELKAAKAK